MKSITRHLLCNRARSRHLVALVLWLACGLPNAVAAVVYEVSLDTSPLVGHAAQPFAINFQLNDGSATGDANNVAIVRSLTFGGGSPFGVPDSIGGVSGDLATAVALTDSAFFNSFVQPFTPGAMLGFRLELSTVADTGPTPDQFSFAILDCAGIEIPTLGAADALLRADITPGGVAIRAFAGDAGRLIGCTGTAGIALPEAHIVVVDEPAASPMLAVGLAALLCRLARRRCRRSGSRGRAVDMVA